ncbi:hypothetical protein [Luteolibacter luteus]|uniref:Uncharacterized protein n=1 Tax=Luteolibacter luteus TaxID=2728835 RepID=A0A858RKU7_9BACT|nr:hypothetical protein [Luteolibacter luteus]QJE97221.1 hypothetical protein HHL09_15970 [Luteolibacter luteus]
MFNNDEQSGMVGMLVGMIVLVFAGVFFSLLADKRFSFSKNQSSISQTIEEEKLELENVKRELEGARADWKREYEPRTGQEELIATITRDSQASRRRLETLGEERDAAAEEAKRVADAFAEYQGRYRQQVRAEAAGEKVGELTTRGGRTYRDVTIWRVSAAGAEIRHSEGSTRLSPNELPVTWNDRFQWDKAELAQHLDEEREAEEQHKQFVDSKNNPPEPPQKTSGKKPKPAKPDEDPEYLARVEVLRQAVIDTRLKLNQARTEANRARYEAASGKGRSVPGSLETWAERARRMEASSAKFHAQYMAARGKLASVAPNDYQLQVQDQ